MKRLLAIFLIMVLLFSTVGCGGKGNSIDSNKTEVEVEEFKEELTELLIGATKDTVEDAFGGAIKSSGNTYYYRVPNHSLMAMVLYTFDGSDEIVESVTFVEL